MRLFFVMLSIFALNCQVLFSQSFPYTIELDAFTIPGLDGVHSFAAAEDNGKWLILSGRADGMHRGGGPPSNPAFPSSNNNTTIYVVDPVNQTTWSANLSSLSIGLQNQLSSTNTSFYQDGDVLYIIGGYGQNNLGNHVTYNNLTAIDVPNLISDIINNNSIVSDFIQITDNRMTVAGGQLGKIGNNFYLVGGMELQSRYTQASNPNYTSEIAIFEILNNGTSISISNYSTYSDSDFHRRDFNLVPQMYPDNTFGYMISSGVFTPSDGVYFNPIELKSTGYNVIPESTFKQELSNYQSANLALYDATQNNMFNIFFGGIAQYYYNNGTKISDSDVPFVKTISMVTRDLSNSYSESVFSTEMPVYLGAGSEFFINHALPMSANGVIDMNQLVGNDITAGYIFGGLQSNAKDIFPSNTSNSFASNTIYRVRLVNTILPIDLSLFTASSFCEDNEVELNWVSNTEENMSKFIIERSAFGNFEKIEEVKAFGSSNDANTYNYRDKNPLRGNSYYRLKMVETDGAFTYSKIVSITICNDQDLEIYPNPTEGKLVVLGAKIKDDYKLYNANGQFIDVKFNATKKGFSFDISHLTNGTYFFKNKSRTYKIIKND